MAHTPALCTHTKRVRISRSRGPARAPAGITQQGTALALYCCTVGLTYAWPVLSFGLHRMDWALAEAVVLLAAEAGTFVAFSGVRARCVG